MNEIENGARRLDRLWYLVVYGGTGAACGAAWLFLRFGGGAPPALPVTLGLGPTAFWSIVGIVVALSLAAAKFALVRFAQPARILELDLRDPRIEAASPHERARLHVQAAVFIVLGMIDGPALVLVGYAIASGDVDALGVALLYSVVVGRLLKPDMTALLTGTTAELSARLARV